MADSIPAPERNYPALFLALDEVLEALADGRPDEDALKRSFEASADGFGAEKAILLIVEDGGPQHLRALASRGLSWEEVAACEKGLSVAGVSSSCIRQALEGRVPIMVQDPERVLGGKVSEVLTFQPCSVLCAPVCHPQHAGGDGRAVRPERGRAQRLRRDRQGLDRGLRAGTRPGHVVAAPRGRADSMNGAMRTTLDDLRSDDRARQNKAFTEVLQATERTVDWAYEVWDEMVSALRHADNHVRAISAQVLCNLAKSDPKGRMLKDFDALLAVTRDERFVTARHCLQSLWKIGIAGKKQQKKVVDGLVRRFEECIAEKNGTLIRYDILQGLRRLYDQTRDDSIRVTALRLVEAEVDLKYRKKYASVWRIKPDSR